MAPATPTPAHGDAVASPRWAVELQSFRGLAALTVLLHHCSFYYDYHASLRTTLEIVINAHAAVVAFFVLSGFVLGMSVSNEQSGLRHVVNYLVRRAFRIYPALWVGCVLGILYMICLYPPPPAVQVSDWWRANLPAEMLGAVGALKAFGGFGRALPLPIWTITIELAGSLLIPVFVYALRLHQWAFIATSLALAALSYFTERLILDYLFLFAIGFSITLWMPWMKQRLASRTQVSTRSRFVVVCATSSLLMLIFGRQLGGWSLSVDYHAFWPNVIEGISAAVLIAIIYSRPDQFSWLRARFPRFLGDISYSLYIVHLPIMAFAAMFLGDMLKIEPFRSGGVLAMMALTLVTGLAAVGEAAISYRWVELPGIRLGRTLIARLSGNAPQRDAAAAAPRA